MNVKLYEVYPDGRERLMNTIDECSKFHGHRLKSVGLSPSEKVLEHARIIAMGWKHNGPRPFSRYKMVIDRGEQPTVEFI